MEIAKGVLLQRGLAYPARTATLKRMANRVREVDRPREPRTQDFNLNENLRFPDCRCYPWRPQESNLCYPTIAAAAETSTNLVYRWYFKVVRLPFYQLLVVHAYYEVGASIKQLALAYILMSSRRSGAYREAIQELWDALPGPAVVEEIMVDFEAALWKIFKSCLHNFHFRHVWWAVTFTGSGSKPSFRKYRLLV